MSIHELIVCVCAKFTYHKYVFKSKKNLPNSAFVLIHLHPLCVSLLYSSNVSNISFLLVQTTIFSLSDCKEAILLVLRTRFEYLNIAAQYRVI